MNLPYLIPRVVRHFLPERAIRFMLRRGMVIRPGLETTDPEAAVWRYLDVLQQEGVQVAGTRALVFGYGGSYAVGCGLLEAQVAHAYLCDPYAPPDDRRNQALWPRYQAYLQRDGGPISPRPDVITLISDDIRKGNVQDALKPVDLVVSSSVYEHLEDVDGITQSLAAVTAPHGSQLHFIDLRDHFFKYPFEMLTYSETTWKRWLNPSSNHNRFRFEDYQLVFEQFFEQVAITVLSRDLKAFEAARPRIRPEFLTGDPQIDAITSIQVLVRQPRAG